MKKMHTFVLSVRLLYAVFTLPRLLSRNREMFDQIMEQSGISKDDMTVINEEVDQKDDVADEPAQNIEPTPSGSTETSDQQTKKEK